jgi:hypothetical protein
VKSDSDTGCLCWNPSHKLRDLGQVALFAKASVSSSVKWEGQNEDQITPKQLAQSWV